MRPYHPAANPQPGRDAFHRVPNIAMNIPESRLNWTPRPHRPRPSCQAKPMLANLVAPEDTDPPAGLAPSAIAELRRRGVVLTTIPTSDGQGEFPTIVLPSGKVIIVAADPDALQPGHLVQFPKPTTET